jgi:hypothetical protein
LSRTINLAIGAACALAGAPSIAWSQASIGASAGRWFYGGSVGLGLGTVTYVGGSLIYQYTKDDRYQPAITTNDYGASVFGRYMIKAPFFAQAELEQLSYEYVRSNLSTTRTDATSLFLGGGVAWPLGSNVSAFATALYNVSYGSQSPSPYSGPWVFRVGVGVGF